MPELPEVETMARGIRPYVEGREIAAVRKCRCRCRPMEIAPAVAQLNRRVRGRTIVEVGRRGKRVLLNLSSGDALVIEPRMTGLLLLADPPDRQHLRVEFQLAGDGEFHSFWYWDLRGLGKVRLESAAGLEERLGPRKLGRDALAMTEADWQAFCGQTRRPIKVALLDQKLAAGIGNLYASEILHRAGIHPEVAAGELRPRQVRRLAAAVAEVLAEAIEYEGSTLGDGTYRNALNQNGGYQNKHRVYGRSDERCLTCGGGQVVRIVQAQRSTFFCPVCQRAASR
jgi:formamidopyrimidine-DNA glycosylase